MSPGMITFPIHLKEAIKSTCTHDHVKMGV